MKLNRIISKPLVAAVLLMLMPLLSTKVFAQAELANLLSLSDGPGAVLYAPISNLGLLPRSIENGGAFFNAGSDILLSGRNPLDIVISLGGPLKGQLVPILDVLMNDPLSTGDFILGGGTIISEGLTIIPAVPLLNSPLPGL